MKETLVKIKLSDIEPNPNRDLTFNPYNEAKLVALMSSINETGFWSNVIVRPHPTKKGKYQQSYGHHRMESARRCGIKEADFVVRDLDENMMLKMMELENQEDYRYCPLSLLESVKAVVLALAGGRIAPLRAACLEDGTLPPVGDPERYKGTTLVGTQWLAQRNEGGTIKALGKFESREAAAQAYRLAIKGTIRTTKLELLRQAPSFVPSKFNDIQELSYENAPKWYTSTDIARFLGRTALDKPTSTAVDALYLLEVKAITTAQIKNMNWSQLGRFVADMKDERERTILRKKKTAEEVAKINAESLRIQAEHKAEEKRIEEERKALVKKLADAKREEDEKKRKEIATRLEAKEERKVELQVEFEVKRHELEKKVEAVHKKQEEAKQEDAYLPIKKATDRIMHLLARRDEEEEVKALARKALNTTDRERLRQAALTKGTWYMEWVATQFLPPLSAKKRPQPKETK